MTDKKNEVDDISSDVDELPAAVNYVNTVAKLYADYSKAKTESEKDYAETRLKQYQVDVGGTPATWSDAEEIFSYCFEQTAQVAANYFTAIDSELLILVRLLKQKNLITNSEKESVEAQFRAIKRDYHILGDSKNGKK